MVTVYYLSKPLTVSGRIARHLRLKDDMVINYGQYKLINDLALKYAEEEAKEKEDE